MSQQYDYPVSDTLNDQVAPTALKNTIEATGSGISIQLESDPTITVVDSVPTLQLVFKSQLPGDPAGEKAVLDAIVAAHDGVEITVIEQVEIANSPVKREDGVVYSVPKPSSFGLVMCDRDFRINTSIFDSDDSLEDLKINPSTNKEENWNELSLHGVFKDDGGGNMVACTDQADANANCIASAWDYCAKLPVDQSLINYELRDGLLYVDPGLAADWDAMTEEEKFGHRSYAMIAPEIPGAVGGSVAVFDSYLGISPNRTVSALSPQATVLNPSGPGGGAAALLRLTIFHPPGSKLSHVFRLVTYRAPGTF